VKSDPVLSCIGLLCVSDYDTGQTNDLFKKVYEFEAVLNNSIHHFMLI